MASFIEDHLEPRWPRYGLGGDPFFSNPLDPDDDTYRPITLFRGRREERRRLDQAVLDGSHSATLIYAAGGFGKTTLSNAASYDLRQERYLVLPEEIVFDPEEGVNGFFRELLHGILQAVSDAGHALPSLPSDPRDVDEADFPGLLKARTLVQLTRVRADASAGVGVVGMGAEGGVGYEFLEPSFTRGASRALLREIVDDVTVLTDGVPGIVVRVNNLDVAIQKDREAVEHFLLEARDLFQVDGLHFFFMGNDLVLDAVEGEPRVQSVFQSPIPLRPFDLDEVLAILEARYEFLAIEGEEATKPVADDLVRELYEVHDGDLRNVLRDLRRSVQTVDPVEAEPVKPEQALPLLEEAHFRRLEEHLNENKWRTLDALAEEGEARQVDLVQKLGDDPSMISRRFTDFEERGVVEIRRVEGQSKYYSLPGNSRLAVRGARRAGLLDSA